MLHGHDMDYFPDIENLTPALVHERYAQLLIEYGCCTSRELAWRRAAHLIEDFQEADRKIGAPLRTIESEFGRERSDLLDQIECLEKMLNKAQGEGIRRKIEEKLAAARARCAEIDFVRQPAEDRLTEFRNDLRSFANSFIATTLPVLREMAERRSNRERSGPTTEANPDLGSTVEPVELSEIRAALAQHQPAVRVLRILARLDGSVSRAESLIVFEFLNRHGAGLGRVHRDWFPSRMATWWYSAPGDEMIDEAIAALRGLPLDYRIDIVGTAVAIVACGGSPKKREAEMLDKIRQIVSTDD